MSDAAANAASVDTSDLPMRVRNPRAFTFYVAVFLGSLGYSLQVFAVIPSTTLAAWEIGALLGILVLWSQPSLEGCTLAFAKRERDPLSFAALAFGYGYFLAVCLVIMQWGSTSLTQSWIMFGVTGLIFGILLARAQSIKYAMQLEPLFQGPHAIERHLVIRVLYVVWPLAAIVGLTWVIVDTSAFGDLSHQVPVLMLMVLAIWPMSYDVSPTYRRVYLTNIALGAALLMAVAIL